MKMFLLHDAVLRIPSTYLISLRSIISLTMYLMLDQRFVKIQMEFIWYDYLRAFISKIQMSMGLTFYVCHYLVCC